MSYVWFVLTFMLFVQLGFTEEENPLDVLENQEQSRNLVRDLLLNLLERDSLKTCNYRTNTCSGHGACGLDARKVEYICYCSDGWGGVICDKPPKGTKNSLKELLDLLDEE